MKRLFYFTFAAVVALGAFSCARNTETEMPQGGRELTVRVDLDEQTRIAFNDGKYAWEGDEVLGAYVMSGVPTVNAETMIALRDGAGYCTLTAPYVAGDKFYAYFPYSRDNVSNMPRKTELEISDQQIQSAAGVFDVENMPMVAMPVVLTEVAQEQAVTMYALGGFLRVNVFASSKYAGEHVQSVAFATTDKAVAGSFEFDMTAFANTDALAIAGYESLSAETDLETVYTVGSALDKSKSIYIVLAPGDYSGKLTVTTDKAAYVCNYAKQIKRNTYYDVNVDLANAERLAAVEPIEATLTYAEVDNANLSLGYGNPKTYANTFGKWTVCCYDTGHAFQINSGKEAYIGTPEFEGEITEIVFNTSESYTGDIAVCTSSSISSSVLTQKGGGATTKIELADYNLKQVYLRSSDKVCRITDITVYCGGGSAPIKPSAPKFVDLTAAVEGASSATAADGKATLSADIDFNSQLLSIVKSGIAYKISTVSAFTERDCGTSAEPEITVTGLKAGTYTYYAYAQMSDGNSYKSEEAEFIIRDKSAAPTNDYKYRWFELPVQHDKDNNGIEDTNPDYYYSHVSFTNNGKKVRNFSACYSRGMMHPVWVAAPMHSCYKGSASRTNNYKNDPNIPFSQNGKFTGYTRGHMIGSSDRLVSDEANRQVFRYSNIGAQLGNGVYFNTGGGVWNNLEDKVDTYWCADTLYQVVGCIFKDWTDRYGKTVDAKTGSGSVSTFQVPTAWYKVLLRTKKGNSGKAVDMCSADELQCVAFIVGHYGESGRKPSSKDMYTVGEVEKLTGLTFFPNVPNAPKDTYKASDWNL